MHSCFSDMPVAPGARVTLSPSESAHVARVLRMRAGDEVRLLDGEGLYRATLESVDAAAVVARALERLPSPEACVKITLFQGMPKADKMDWIVQKATELGAWSVQPVMTERAVAGAERDAKRERWARIALEAAKQSGRAHVPQIGETLSFQALADALAGFDAAFVAWEEEHALRVTQAVACASSPHSLAFIVGPEGGLSGAEVARLNAAGAHSVTLGKRILRTETAGLCCIVSALAALGEL